MGEIATHTGLLAVSCTLPPAIVAEAQPVTIGSGPGNPENMPSKGKRFN